MILDTVIYFCVAVVVLSMAAILYRVIQGPTIADRVIALDSIGIGLISVVALLSIVTETAIYFEVILLLGILAFIGTVAFSKFIEKGEIIEHDRHDT